MSFKFYFNIKSHPEFIEGCSRSKIPLKLRVTPKAFYDDLCYFFLFR